MTEPVKPDKKKRLDLLTEKDLGEFSKRIIVALIRYWFAFAIFGAIVVAVQVVRGDYTTDLSSLLMYVGAAPVSALFGYAGKYIFENPAKIKALGKAKDDLLPGPEPGGDDYFD